MSTFLDEKQSPDLVDQGGAEFQKKSKTGIKTPLPEVNVIRERVKRLKEMQR
jgi:hypothetical protein